MSENGFQFRTAAIGGFQKQDVMDYLERSAREHAQRLAGLQKELEGAKQAQTAETERAALLESRLATLEAENQRLAADLADRESRLAQAAAGQEELQALAARLQAEVARLTPSADAYETVKDRTASIELEAHGRAQAIEREGRARVLKCQEQVRGWFGRTQETYARLRLDVNAVLNRTVQELEQVGRSMTALAQGLEAQDEALAALGAHIEALESAKPPYPLDLDPTRQ